MNCRDFLAALPALPVVGGADSPPKAPPDPPRELPETAADLGTLFPEVGRIADANRYALEPFAVKFPNARFRTYDEYRAAARDTVLDLLLYRPGKVDPRPEVLEKVDRGDHVRELVLFSTSPASRVPAYVLVPKGLKKPAPAVVDLHSHGGMFLFGKEKVIDLGDNHPAMTAYHQQKGLVATDYGVGGWNIRISTLNRTDTDRAVFDVALSSTLFRYMSDLSIGRVNPQHVNFDLDIDEKKPWLPAVAAQ